MKNKHILVAEDDSVTRKNMARVLQEEGYTVTLAADGQEAVTRLSADQPDLILTNLHMPRLNGTEVLTRVQQTFPNIPVFLISALVTPKIKRQARQLGARDFVEKPFDFDDLLARIAGVLVS